MIDYTAAIDAEAAAWATFFNVTDEAEIEGRRNVMRANVAVGYVEPLQEFLTAKVEAPTMLTLHLDAQPLSASFVRRIKAVGGKYSHCRGDRMTRYIDLPSTEITLINELVRKHGNGKTTMVMRPNTRLPSWVVVQYVDARHTHSPCDQFKRKYAAALEQAKARGLA